MAKLYNETGFSRKKGKDEVCDGILEFVKPFVEAYSGKTFRNFACEHYMEKPNYGKNYKIKVKTDVDYMHLHVYKPPKGNPQVNFIERGRKEEDDLALPFDMRNITPWAKAGSFWDYSS